jgi:CRP-like cAMP-binding protein
VCYDANTSSTIQVKQEQGMISGPQPSLPLGNKILAALNSTSYQRFLSQLEPVTLSLGEVIYNPGAKIQHVYFPETAVFSMLCTLRNGDTVEVGPVGREGMVGLDIFFGTSTTTTQQVIQVGGTALKMSAEVLREEIRTETSLIPPLLLRYTHMLLAMTGQSSACNKFHSVEEQLSRWLLMMHDYVGEELLLTHELIALTLGVRRAGISESANDFKKAGLIDYRRGRIRVLNRQGLEAVACECYKVIRAEYDRLYADLAMH